MLAVENVGKKEKTRHTWFWYGFEKQSEVLNNNVLYRLRLTLKKGIASLYVCFN